MQRKLFDAYWLAEASQLRLWDESFFSRAIHVVGGRLSSIRPRTTNAAFTPLLATPVLRRGAIALRQGCAKPFRAACHDLGPLRTRPAACLLTADTGTVIVRHASNATGPEGPVRALPTTSSLRAGSGVTSRDFATYLVALTVAMVGLTYASVPLYRMFCQMTGYGGTVQRGDSETVEQKMAKAAEDKVTYRAAAAREILITFNADVADGMQWKFVPSQRQLRVTPGQSTLAFYTATNLSKEDVTGVSVYNVTPMRAGVYFHKIQCFCFEEQRLRPGETLDMPVFFYIDPEFATDPKMQDIDEIRLSYTFFKALEDGAPHPALAAAAASGNTSSAD